MSSEPRIAIDAMGGDEGVRVMMAGVALARRRHDGLRFTLFLGELPADTRAGAEDLHARSGGDTASSVLIAISPDQRVMEVVTGAAAARRLPDRACALAVLSMTTSFGSGDLVGGIVNGLRQLSDQAGHPAANRRRT